MRNLHNALWDNTAILNSYMAKCKKESGSYISREEGMKMIELAYLAQIADCLQEIATGKRIT